MAFHKKGESKYIPTSIETKPVVYRPKYKKSKRKKHSEHELPEICRFCINAHKLYDSDTMLCDHRGVVACEYTCKKFMYDPLKHIPAQSPVLKPENADPLPSLDDFNDIDDSQNSEATLEKDADTVKSGASSNIREKELKDIRSGDSTENDDIESVKKNAINDRELLDQLAEIDRQYNLLQRDFAEYTASRSDEIQTDNISDAFSNVFSKDNDADMKENPEDTDSE